MPNTAPGPLAFPNRSVADGLDGSQVWCWERPMPRRAIGSWSLFTSGKALPDLQKLI